MKPETPPSLDDRMLLLECQSHTILYLCAANLFVNALTILIAVGLALA